jgi:arylsulfatase
MLLPHGYNTFLVGKWHLSPPEHETPAGPYDRWPPGRGFERFYGFLGGDTNQWYPDLVYDNHSIEQPAQPEDGYHLSADLADKAIEFIQDARQRAGQAASTSLLHRRRSRAAPCRQGVGRQVQGQVRRRLGRSTARWSTSASSRWASSRRDCAVRARPRRTGVGHPAGERPEAIRPDDGGVHAGFVSYTDHEFGRVVSFLEEIGELDNIVPPHLRQRREPGGRPGPDRSTR